eukprot:XP_001703760.1 predicted protein [Chlamydomonas reinhardtii]
MGGASALAPTTQNSGTGMVFGADLLTGFTLYDFLPAPWKDMHVRFLKDITSSSPPTRSLWSCRKAAPQPTLELRTMTGRPLYMQVSITSGDLNGESTHVIGLQRSSLDTALSERRVRLTVSDDGLVSATSQGLALQVLSLEPSRVHVEPPSDEEAAAGQGNHVYVDLWPVHAVSGVLQLDATGRITSVLEEHTRPAGLLFGLHHDALIGEALDSLVTMPPGRTSAAELLSLHGAKKSNLKTKQKDVAVKVGPVHKLRATHTDGKPLVLDVQVVGKPGPNEPVIAILRLHTAPMAPAAAAYPAAAAPPPPSLGGPLQPAAGLQEPAAAVAAIQPRGAASIKRQPSLDDLMDKVEAAGSPDEIGKKRNSKESSSVGQVHTPPTGGSLRRNDSTAQQKPRGSGVEAAVDPAGGAAEAPLAPPPMPAMLLGGVGDGGLPVPSVTAAATGRNKLADLVKSVGGDQAGSQKAALGSGDGSGLPVPRTRPGATRRSSTGDGGSAADLPHAVPLARGEGKGPDAEKGMEAQSVDGDDDDKADSEGGGKVKGGDRILSWVASKGAFYQNSVAVEGGANAKSDDEGSVKAPSDGAASGLHAPHSDMTGLAYAASERTERTVATMATMATARTLAGLKASGPPDLPYADDDAGSEGGQSAMSAQSSSGGAEYKRGKRFRKLVKLMDSGQAQQVQKRFKLHALITVGILAAVHVVCFATTLVAIGQQRASMLQLGRSVELQLSLHQILADVRSMDVITKNKTLPTLYTADDSTMFLDRIAVNAEKMKDRLNDILDNHHARDSSVMTLFYFTNISVWNGREQNGSDAFINVTIWDFGTRIYSMTKLVQQSGAQWLADGVSFVDQDPGQFLIKSGPDFFRASRRILDALLYAAVDSAKRVNTLQLVFLAVEGAAISCAAACYLAYLLRAVAAQRYKLYGTFLVIPVGLTRALASQNTTLLVDAQIADTPGGKKGGSRKKPAAPWESPREGARVPGGGGGGVRGSDVLLPGDDDDGASGVMAHQRTYTGSFSSGGRSRAAAGGCWGWVRRLMFRSRSLGSVSPLPSTRVGSILNPRGWTASSQQALAAAGQQAGSKRTLKYDSHDTAIMLTPFVMWSVLVIAFYASAVIEMRDVVDTVAVHSVVNFMNARTSRNVFLSQELAVVEDPALVPAKQLALQAGVKLVRDAFYTLQLGDQAYRTAVLKRPMNALNHSHNGIGAAGNATERYPLVTKGLSFKSPRLADLFYGGGTCHRQFPEYLPCPGPEYRYYEISHTGFDTMMQQFLRSLESMAFNSTGLPQGLASPNFDYIYNVGYKDMIGAILEIKEEHYNIIVALFDTRRLPLHFLKPGILLLHIILFLMLWVIFAGFLFILLNPLLKRVSKEGDQGADATNKWKAIIKQASTNFKSGKRASADNVA